MRDENFGKKGKIKLSTLKKIVPFVLESKIVLVYIFFAVLLVVALEVSLPLVFRELIDRAIPSKDFSNIVQYGVFYLGILIFLTLIKYVLDVIVGFMGINIVNGIKDKMLQHILSLSIRFFDKNETGKLISKIESDTQKLFMLFSSVGIRIVWATFNIIASFFIMFSISAKLTLYVFTMVPIYIIGAYILFSKMRPLFKKERELYGEILGFLGEHIKSIPILKSLNNISWSRDKFSKMNFKKAKFETGLYVRRYSIFFVMMLIPDLIVSIILYKSVFWVGSSILTIGTIWMFIQYIEAMIRPLIVISEQIGEVQMAFGAADRIFEILELESELVDGETPLNTLKFNNEICFQDVSFHYDVEKPVLKKISFTIEKGSTVAIVGATGSGKSTIINLLMRFYDPIKGAIFIDGHNLCNLKFKDIRSHIGLVLQDVFLFPGDVISNLKVMREDISDEDAINASKIMGAFNYIENLPDGFSSELTEDGTNLSFGERQLLSFSRALTFNPEIIIMDEATSSVDPYTERKIQQSMQVLLKGRTSIIIAHRLSTIKHADKILVINDGELVEEGSHAHLMGIEGKYQALYNTQINILGLSDV